MVKVNQEIAKYIVKYYSDLLTDNERMAVKHHSHNIKNGSTEIAPQITSKTKIYKEAGWMTDNPIVLNLLNEGYDSFELKVAQRILERDSEKVFLNNCPECGRLARTPEAKQCRFCGITWHAR